jgi:polar amino acid transport system substrate-binding protein
MTNMSTTSIKAAPGAIRIAAFGLLAAIVASVSAPASAQTLDRIRDSKTIRLGYESDARPFSFKDEAGQPAGYAVALCTIVADRAKTELGLTDLTVEWVPLEGDARFAAVKDGTVDLLCGADVVTLARRAEVSFSIPIFPSGTGAVLNAASPLALREVLVNGQPGGRPIWRGSPARTVLERMTFSVIPGSTSETWLNERISAFNLDSTVVPVDTYAQGLERVVNGRSNVLFGELPILLDAAAHSPASGNLIVLDRHFTYEPLGLAMQRGDEDLRLLVDTALSDIYRSEGFRDAFTEWFGPPDDFFVTFFRQTALPE